MISTNSQLPIRSATPMDPIHDEASGIANVQDRARQQRLRDNHNWFEGLLAGLFWGMIAGALIVFALVVIFTH